MAVHIALANPHCLSTQRKLGQGDAKRLLIVNAFSASPRWLRGGIATEEVSRRGPKNRTKPDSCPHWKFRLP